MLDAKVVTNKAVEIDCAAVGFAALLAVDGVDMVGIAFSSVPLVWLTVSTAVDGRWVVKSDCTSVAEFELPALPVDMRNVGGIDCVSLLLFGLDLIGTVDVCNVVDNSSPAMVSVEIEVVVVKGIPLLENVFLPIRSGGLKVLAVVEVRMEWVKNECSGALDVPVAVAVVHVEVCGFVASASD